MTKALPTLLFALSISSIIPVSAQEFSPNRWKETGRLNQNKEDVHYSDTVFLVTEDRQIIDVIIGGYAYRGTIKDDSLDIKKRTFQVLSNEPDEIKLKFAKLTHTFTRELKGTVAADAAAFVEQNKIPEAPVKKINGKLLNGNWLVYKKLVREGYTIDIKTVQYLKKIEIWKQLNKGAKGMLANSSNINMKIKDVKGSDIRFLNSFNQLNSLTILKQTKNELILEDGQHVIYYLKKY